MANYAVDPGILQKYLPNKTELDIYNGTCFISLVAFMFLGTKLKGIRIPFHSDFEEVNLRFYVTHTTGLNEIKRGVVFIKEFVPRSALTFIANTIYKEHYETVPMNHTLEINEDSLTIEYKWKKGNWNSFQIFASNALTEIANGTEEEFITEHYWGYTKISEKKTSEYGVEHPKWKIHKLTDYSINADFGLLYGEEFAFLSNENPLSVFLAEGSEIIVRQGRIISG